MFIYWHQTDKASISADEAGIAHLVQGVDCVRAYRNDERGVLMRDRGGDLPPSRLVYEPENQTWCGGVGIWDDSVPKPFDTLRNAFPAFGFVTESGFVVPQVFADSSGDRIALPIWFASEYPAVYGQLVDEGRSIKNDFRRLIRGEADEEDVDYNKRLHEYAVRLLSVHHAVGTEQLTLMGANDQVFLEVLILAMSEAEDG